MLLSLLNAALAAPCDQPVSPDAWSREVRDLVELVVLAEDGVQAQVDALNATAPCADAPIERAELARLWLARGAMLTLGDASPAEAQRALAAAKALGAEQVWDPSYGPVVRRLLQEAVVREPGTLVMSLPHDVLVVDGEVVYEPESIRVPAGSHLVQWSMDGTWQGEWIEVNPGNATLLGEPAAHRAELSLPGVPALGEVDLSITLGTGYANAWSNIYVTPEGVTTIRAGGQEDAGDLDYGGVLLYRSGGATGSASAELGWRMAWLSLSGELAPAHPLTGRWPASVGATALLGARTGGRWWSLAGGAGLRLADAPRARAPETWSVINAEFALPEYESATALGPALGVQARVGGPIGFVFDGELWGGPVASGWQLSFGPTARYGALEPGLRVRTSGTVVAQYPQRIATPDVFHDVHAQVGAEATLGVRF